ncbi:hypothetical protein EIP91_008891 [Steccherinum ochraceum]|uniref:Lysosomal dipeptide transporter MFSD1 n=1 Tax=Steccherinum ochraceum TaxID=92696 RepID=A0A4R0RRI3_9APHY|nr:hypothetical protein EIP91_008891 [Steccherinum ochraceum]
MAREGSARAATHGSPHPETYQYQSDERIPTDLDELDNTVEELHVDFVSARPSPLRAYLIRALALLCACSLSVGSHYASYILGPLKSRLSREMGTDNTEFSLLISAFSLNSTWTPLVGGILASRLGTTMTSILATGVVFLGQLFLLIGNLTGSVRLMAFGMFVFGFGVSPLAVVQETIIVRFFKSHGLGISLALGLVAGKGASFVSARTSYPLSQQFGPHAPFYVATGLAGLSFCINIIYLLASKWLIQGAGAEWEASELHAEAQTHEAEHIRSGSVHSLSEAEALKAVAKKRMVKFKDITKLGDVFWAYIGLNVFCGMIWAPWTHLAANIIQRRFHMSESGSSEVASYILAGSVFLYPITGWAVDALKHRGIVLRLLATSSILTLLCYIWMALPPEFTRTPIPGIISFGLGHGFSPLLLVCIVPEIVPLKYVSTTLGAHKALEQTGSTIFQTLSGLVLDVKSKKPSAESLASPNGDETDMQYLLNTFVAMNVLQFLAIVVLAHFDRKRKQLAARRLNALLATPVVEEEESDSDDSHAGRAKEPVEPQEDITDSGRSAGTIRSIRSISMRRPSVSRPEQQIPLLRSPSQASSARSSRYLIPGVPPSQSVPFKFSKSEIRRGRIFAMLSGCMIVDSPIRKLYPDDVYPNGSYYPSPYGRVRYWIVGPSGGRKVSFIHGISTPSIIFKEIVGEVVKAGFQVLLYDIYGRGYSEGPQETLSITDYVNQLALLLQYVGWSQTDVVGLSMGGGIATGFTATFPHLVSGKVVLIASAGLLEIPLDAEGNRTLPQTNPIQSAIQAANAEQSQTAGDIRSLQTQLLPGYGKVIQDSMKYGPIGSMQKAYEILAKVQTAGGPAEVLVVHGTDDAIVAYENATKIKKIVAQAKVVTIEGAGHFLVGEPEHWPIAAKSIVDFLSV